MKYAVHYTEWSVCTKNVPNSRLTWSWKTVTAVCVCVFMQNCTEKRKKFMMDRWMDRKTKSIQLIWMIVTQVDETISCLHTFLSYWNVKCAVNKSAECTANNWEQEKIKKKKPKPAKIFYNFTQFSFKLVSLLVNRKSGFSMHFEFSRSVTIHASFKHTQTLSNPRRCTLSFVTTSKWLVSCKSFFFSSIQV